MYGKSAKSLAQQGFPCIAPWPRRRRKGAMKTSKKWRKSLFRQPKRDAKGVPFKLGKNGRRHFAGCRSALFGPRPGRHRKSLAQQAFASPPTPASRCFTGHKNNRGGALGGVGTPEAGFAYGGHSGGQVGKAPGRKKRYRTGVSGGYDTASQTSLYSPVAFANLTAAE